LLLHLNLPFVAADPTFGRAPLHFAFRGPYTPIPFRNIHSKCIVIPRAPLARGICFCLNSAPRISAPLHRRFAVVLSQRLHLNRGPARKLPPFLLNLPFVAADPHFGRAPCTLPFAATRSKSPFLPVNNPTLLARAQSSRRNSLLHRPGPSCPDERKGRADTICSQGRKPLEKRKTDITPLGPFHPPKLSRPSSKIPPHTIPFTHHSSCRNIGSASCAIRLTRQTSPGTHATMLVLHRGY
jgi:hypothetical protein